MRTLNKIICSLVTAMLASSLVNAGSSPSPSHVRRTGENSGLCGWEYVRLVGLYTTYNAGTPRIAKPDDRLKALSLIEDYLSDCEKIETTHLSHAATIDQDRYEDLFSAWFPEIAYGQDSNAQDKEILVMLGNLSQPQDDVHSKPPWDVVYAKFKRAIRMVNLERHVESGAIKFNQDLWIKSQCDAASNLQASFELWEEEVESGLRTFSNPGGGERARKAFKELFKLIDHPIMYCPLR